MAIKTDVNIRGKLKLEKVKSHKNNLDTIEEALKDIEKPGETLDDLIDFWSKLLKQVNYTLILKITI